MSISGRQRYFRAVASKQLRISAALLLVLLASQGAFAQAPDLAPTGYINDYSRVLSAPEKARLESLATEVKQKTGAEIAVAIVPTIGDESLENYANLLAEKWGVGDEQDRGFLLLLAIQDRTIRLEVGYGLEPILTDGRAGEIRDQMTPYLREQDYDSAVAICVMSVARIIAQDAGVTLTGLAAQQPSRRRDGSSGSKLWLLLFLLPFLPFGRRRRYGGWHGNAVTTAWMLGSLTGGGRGYGGSGGGSVSSGGFGGFSGGGFGGGGASGSW